MKPRKPHKLHKLHKYRVEFRKNRAARPRASDLTRAIDSDPDHVERLAATERLSGKGELTRKRTVVGTEGDRPDGLPIARATTGSWRGRVLFVNGLVSAVERPDGRVVRCTTRRVLRTMATEQRHVVTAGDWVEASGEQDEGVIESIEPRGTSLCRTSRCRRHVIVANVDQVVIVGSAARPNLKPGLIDRFLVAAESAGIRPLICLNKADLIDPASLVPLAGVYARMGYPVILCSAASGLGLRRLEAELPGKVTAVVGQSGVGKSSILNSLEPGLELVIGDVSDENEKGRHTTTTARLIPHRHGGHFVDTPGIRQFQLWQTVAAEVSSAFRDLRPFANHCRFPNCSHTHESPCAVKDAVADGLLDTRRWESCCQLVSEDGAEEE